MFPSKAKLKSMKVCTVIGSMALLLSGGLLSYWANLSVYVASYFVFYANNVRVGDAMPWTISVFDGFISGGIFLYPQIKKILGRRGSTVLGILATDFGFVGTCFTVQYSLLAFNVTLGACVGFGTGILYACTIELTVIWAKDDLGFLLSLVHGALSLGSIGINQLVTLYLNPANELPGFRVGKFDYFPMADILRRVPSIFLILGGVSFTVHLIGLALVRDYPLGDLDGKRWAGEDVDKDEDKNIHNRNSEVGKYGSYTLELHREASTEEISRDMNSDNGKGSIQRDFQSKNVCDKQCKSGTALQSTPNERNHSRATFEESIEKKDAQCCSGQSNVENPSPHWRHYGTNTPSLCRTGTEMNYKSSTNKNSNNSQKDVSPRALLRSATFYAIWVAFVLGDYSVLPFYNYLKLFGQTWIHDDHFFANLGTCVTAVSVGVRVFWGMLRDRIGSKMCMATANSLMSLLLLWFYFTAIPGKWTYLCASLLVGLFPSAYFICYTIIVAEVFGKTHFSSNYACVKTSKVMANVLAPVVMTAILDHLGWYFVFALAGLSSTLCLCLVLVFVQV